MDKETLIIILTICGFFLGGGGAITLLQIGLKLGQFEREFIKRNEFNEWRKEHSNRSDIVVSKLFSKVDSIFEEIEVVKMDVKELQTLYRRGN